MGVRVKIICTTTHELVIARDDISENSGSALVEGGDVRLKLNGVDVGGYDRTDLINLRALVNACLRRLS